MRARKKYTLGTEEFVFDVLLFTMPIIGLIGGLIFGGIDMQYKHSYTQGKVRILSALGSHTLYALIALAPKLGGVL